MRSSNAGAERICGHRTVKLATQPVGAYLRYTTFTCPSASHSGRWPSDSHALVGFVIAAGLVLVLTPLVGRLAPLIGGLDDKADRPRVHKGAIPRIGGLAIVAGILDPDGDPDRPRRPLPRASSSARCCVAALGLFDDLRGITPEPQARSA